MPVPQVGPRQKVVVTVPFAKPAFKAGAEYSLKLGFRLLKTYDWAPKGYELAAGQIGVPNPRPAKPALVATDKDLGVNESATAVIIKGQNFTAEFDPATCTLTKLIYGGKGILSQGIALNAFRCPVNNDVWAMGKWFDQGLRNLTHSADGLKVERVGEQVRLTAVVVSKGERAERCVEFGGNHTRIEAAGRELDDTSLQFRSQLTWTVYPDGSIAMQTAIVPSGPVMPLPKVGVRMELPEGFGNVTYFGRGPDENYPDRKSGSFLGQYSRTVREMFVPYARPNDMGNREEVRWIALTDAAGDGAVFSSLGEPMSAAALPYSASELLLANHPPELPKSTRTVLTLDAAVLGLGGASCGPGPLERDIPKSNRAYHLGFMIRPLNGKVNPAAASRVSAPLVAPVAVMLQKNQLLMTTATPGAVIKYQLNDAPVAESTAPVSAKGGDKIVTWAERNGFAASSRTVFEVPMVGDKSRYAIKYVSSQQRDEGEAEHLIDGDPDTYWHTEYGLTVTKHPHTVDIDLGEAKSFKGVACLPRQGAVNGRVAQYRFAISDDAKTWTTAAEGKFPNSGAQQKVAFGKTVAARYLRFTVLSEVNGQDFASAAEIELIP